VANLVLPDGRIFEYAAGGPADGFPLVAHHGTPSGAVLDPELVEAAGRHGLRTILPARAGYDGSTALPGRTVAGVAADVAALLDGLGLDRFVTVGWSGGGPHALACAALLPRRCRAATTIAGVAPYDAAGLDWFAGMGDENLAEFGAAAAGAGELTAYLEEAAEGLAGVGAGHLAAALGDLVSDVDKRALTGGFADYLAASIRAALSTGIAGWRDDDLAFLTGWGFGLDGFGVPVAIWQGDEDRMVPFDHGRWLATHIPGAAVHLEPGEGHLSLLTNRLDAILADLAGAA
jgi:pimeloyl-ACP methyl ester carboxylesterase